MPDPGLATAADYSEALLTARRAKSTVCLLLALFLVGQIAVFLTLRYYVKDLPAGAGPLSQGADVSLLHGVDHGVLTTQPSAVKLRLYDTLEYLSGVIVLSGIALSIVLAMTLCLIGHIMLVGRLIGVGRVTGAIVWALVLIVFLLPWQAFLQTDFRLAGALWTWGEVSQRYLFDSTMTGDNWPVAVLSWFRFVGAPLVALVLVLLIQLRSNRGLRMALGEDELLNEMLRQS